MTACPCGQPAPYESCCGGYHAGAEPMTAEQLMRARYSAFACKNAAFLIRTAHPLARSRLSVRDFASSFALTWIRLEVVTTSAGLAEDREGMVHFRAHYRDAAGVERVLEERSRFSRAGGCWVYRDARG